MARLLGIAAAQMRVVPWSLEETLQRMEERLDYIRRSFPWTSLVCFPELCPVGHDSMAPSPPEQALPPSATSIPGPLTERLAAMASRYRVWLQPGSIPEYDGSALYNTALVFSPQGDLVARYRKLFPWRPWETVAVGSEFCTFDIPAVGRFGLCVCYDGWFPEVIRTLVWMGAEVILHPTLTATVDRDAEVTIEQAHAIFNQCYMVNTNAASTAGRGRSLIVDPEGRILQSAGTEDAVLTATIDLDLVWRVRELGTVGLNQHLKQWGQYQGTFPPYSQGIASGPLFQRLGPLYGLADRPPLEGEAGRDP